MTNRNLLTILLFFVFHITSIGQGEGRLQIHADLSKLVAYDSDLEISVINMVTNQELVRQKVSAEFKFAFPLNGRYLLYFKKEGFNTTRLLLDTRTFMSGIYTVNFGLAMSKNNSGDEVISIPIGTIKFDKTTTNFGFKASNLLANHSLKVVSSIRESDVVSF